MQSRLRALVSLKLQTADASALPVAVKSVHQDSQLLSAGLDGWVEGGLLRFRANEPCNFDNYLPKTALNTNENGYQCK